MRIFTLKVALILLIIQGIVFNMNAQTKIGGVCDIDDVILWLKADAGVTMDGSNAVSAWQDQSAHAHVATQSDNSLMPTYVADGGDGYPVLRFNDDFLRVVDNDVLDGESGISIIAVMRTFTTLVGHQAILTKATAWRNQEAYSFYVRNDGDIRFRINRGDGDAQGNREISINNPYILSASYDHVSRNSLENYYNSNLGATDNYNVAITNYNSDLRIGSMGDTGWQLNGDIAEIIVFNKGIKNAERLILENYLSEKYNIAVTSDLFAVDGNYDSNYFTGYTGIGQESDGVVSISDSDGFYISENGGTLSNGEYITFAHSNTANSIVTTDINGSVEARWARDWWVEKTSIDGINANVIFDLPEGIAGGQYPQNISNYVLLFRTDNTNDYSIVTSTASIGSADQVVFDVTDGNLNNGYYTLGTINQTDSPLDGKPGIVWHSLKTGNWNDWETWTLDPSGAIPNNPDHLYPKNGDDHVVIKDGKTVTMNVDDIHCAHLEVEGRLDLAMTTGHTFDVITGGGRIMMAMDNFPSYSDCSYFIDQGKDEGTVVYYGNNINLTTGRTFYNMEVNMTDGQVLAFLSDHTINGNLTVNSGTLQINNNALNEVRTIETKGNVTINAGAFITTGERDTYATHDQYHQFIIKGNFTNNGTALFTNRNTAAYTIDDNTGACEVIFNNDNQNQIALCNGVTVFNQLTCDKGVDDTYVLDISANNADNFKLYGRNNESVTGDNELGGNRDGNKALRLLAGTLKLGSNIVIDELSSAASYDVDTDACLWLYANASVTIDGANYLAVYGTFKCSDNSSYNEITANGTILRARGILNFEGGIHNINTIRTSTWGGAGDHLGAYVQSGGTVNLKAEVGGYATFHLPFQTNVFNMSGGVLNITDQGNWGDGDDYAMVVNSTEDNSSVTGGTVIIDVSQDFGAPAKLNLRAPVWNLILRNSFSRVYPIELDAYTATNDNTETMAAMPLRVLNDFTIESADYTNSMPAYSGAKDVIFNTNNIDVSIGRNFYIHEGAAYNYGTNTTTFNGTENGELYIGHTKPFSSGNYEQHFNNFVLNKPVDKSLTVIGDEEKQIQYQLDNGLPPYAANLVRIDGDLIIESGILDQGKHNVRLYGTSNTIASKGQCGVYVAGTTSPYTLIMFKDGTINTEEGAVFGNLKLNPGTANVISFTSDVYVKRIFYTNGILDLGSSNLKVDYLDDYNSGIDAGTYSYDRYEISDGNTDEFIRTNGEPSDGGLTMLINGNGTYGIPIGVSGKYTPVEIVVSDYVDNGYITINPVDEELKTANYSGGDLLSYYWRIRNEEFSDLPNVRYSFIYDDSNVVGNEAGYYPGMVLSESPYTRSFVNDLSRVDVFSNTITYDNGSGGALPLVQANYTAGQSACFTGEVEIYYSRDVDWNANWHINTSWTRNDILDPAFENHDHRQPPANDYPQEGDVAVIGWVPWDDTGSKGDPGQPHGILINNKPETCAEVVFTQMKDASGNPTGRDYRMSYLFRPCLIFSDVNAQLNTDLVRGEGMLWAQIGDPNFSLMDLGEFAKQDSAYIIYENFTSGLRTISGTPDELPNLMISNNGWGVHDYDITLSKNIKTNGNFEILGNANILLDNDADGDLIIGRDLVFFEVTNPDIGPASGGGAELAFQNTGTPRTVTVGRDILLYNNGNVINVRSANGTPIDHTLNVGRNIHQTHTGTGLNLCDGPLNDRVTLQLIGDDNMTMNIDAGTNPDLYRLVVNKGTDQSAVASINSNFTLQGPTAGVDVEKALELKNGTLIFNHTDIDVDLTTGDNNFDIPFTSALEISLGTVNASNNSGIDLDGLLRVSGTGTLDMRDGDNPIIYSASGNATLEVVDNGKLYVGSQIRRDESSLEGVLKFKQTGGVVEIGEHAAGQSNRGIFEVLNPGSSFEHTGGSLTIVNDLRSNSLGASIYLNPENVSISNNSTLSIGNANTTLGGNKFTIYSSAFLQNILIDNASNQFVELISHVVPLTVNGNLNITSGAKLNANNLDLIIKGNLINSGEFIANNNRTYFSGITNQTITFTGTGEFYDLYKNTANKLTLANDITVSGETHLLNGTFDDGGNSLFAHGDMFIDINTTSSSGGGIVASGTEQQSLVGSPTIAVFKMDNPRGVLVPIGNQISISDKLILNKGIFDIDQNLLIIEKDAEIVEASSFSNKNMIQTNISFTDAGIKKYYKAINTLTSFTYPIGSLGKYTPVTFAIRSINENGAIRVKAADEHQPTIQDGLGLMGSNETNNVLQYYWILDAENTVGVDADVVMQAHAEDEAFVDPNTVSEYITARLRSRNSGVWEKYGNASSNDYNEGTSELIFHLSGNDDQIDGDYTAGIDGAIPDHVAQYVSQNDGEWGTASTWLPNIVGGPRGARVLVRHNVTMEDSYKVSYETRIEETGKLSVNDTYGHRLGNVMGTGTLYLESGDLPAGEYNDFFAPDSGRIEYGGTLDYDVLSSIPSCNSVIVSGSGDRRLPNIEIQLHGDLTINGPNLINEHRQRLNIKKDIDFIAGTYTSGTETDCVINFNGVGQQEIKGGRDFTAANSSSFYNIELNNSGGLLLSNNIEIANNLTFGSGIIYSSVDDMLTVTNSAVNCVTGIANSNYVSGPMRKTISAGDQFNFPVGDANRFGNIVVNNVSHSGNWEAQYYNHNPNNDLKDPTSVSGAVKFVSHNEYWRVEAPASGNTANMTLRWDSSSGVTPDSEFRVVRWTDATPDVWSELAIGTTTGNASAGTVGLNTNLAFGFNGGDNSHYITFGSISIPEFDWQGDESANWFTPGNWASGTIPDAGTDITIANVSNNPIIDNSALAQVNNLTLNSGATLTLQAGARMTINGDVVCDDNAIIVQNTIAEPTSLMSLGTITDGATTDRKITVQWTYPDSRYMYVGHSVDDVVYSNYDTPATSFDLYRYSGGWSRINASNLLDGTENAVEGYAVKFNDGADRTISHSGLLRNSNYSRAINGWNLIGNPYQTYIDIENAGFDKGNSLPTIWVSTNAGTELIYATYNIDSNVGANGGSRYIAPGQSFWLRNYSASTFNLSNSVRTHTFISGNGMLKSSSFQPDDVLRLKMCNEDLSDELVLVFRPNGSLDFTKSDSEKRMGSAKRVPNVYAKKGNKKIVIGLYPELANIDTVFLGYKFGEAKEITLKATNINEFGLGDAYLVDKLNNTVTNLRTNPQYTFETEAKEVGDRFALVFEQEKRVATNTDPNVEKDRDVLIYGYKSKGYVRVSDELLHKFKGKGDISLYSVNGELIEEHKLTETITEIDLPKLQSVYIIRVKLGVETYAEKVVN